MRNYAFLLVCGRGFGSGVEVRIFVFLFGCLELRSFFGECKVRRIMKCRV